MTSYPRRLALQILALGSSLLPWRSRQGNSSAAGAAPVAPQTGKKKINGFRSHWETSHDRVWLGKEFWANPMEDWKVENGAAECLTGAGDRNIHLVTHQITNADGAFEMSVNIETLTQKKQKASAGFRVGIRSDLNEFRSNSFANGGINAGFRNGSLMLGNKTKQLAEGDSVERLRLVGKPDADKYSLTLKTLNADGETVTEVTTTVPKSATLGNIAIVNNFDAKLKPQQGGRYRFRDWEVSGDAFTVTDSNSFGPILWSMYSLSDSRSDEGFVMKISALTPPLGDSDNKTVELQVDRGGKWKSLGHAVLDPDAWVATFRVSNWDETKDHAYRLVYVESRNNKTTLTDTWTGTVLANPTGRALRLGALTCQNHYGFPYEPVAENLVKLKPDMLYFSGDQLYESHGGYGIIRDPADRAILNYLRKYYMFGWAFREPMRNAPTICIPDDHDVFQGNISGEGGAPMADKAQGASSKGGYREPAKMVNAVHLTNCGHHPDFYDPTPCEQDISVYYGDMVYGNVSFAILGDRQWKSGPTRVETGSGRADHVKDMNVDTLHLDKPGLVLLGERQEEFLKHWVDDWRGHELKVLLSQTVFSGVATHHGGMNGYLKADLDSGGWPQTPRNNAVRILRKGMPLHINGDQHLTTLSQYGADAQRDGCWSFCTPAIAAGYPRWWRPDVVGMPHKNRPKHGLADTGEFEDGLGNKVYVYAVGNPEVGTDKNRYKKAHQKASGFGMVTIDTKAKTYTLDSFRFLVDATDGNPDNQFPGWPVTIHQQENGGKNILS